MKPWFLSCLVLAYATSCSHAGGPVGVGPVGTPLESEVRRLVPPHRSTASIRVMSYNVRDERMDSGERGWEVRAPLVAALVARVAPDVLGVQEASAAQVRFLSDALPWHGVVASGVVDGGEAGAHNAVFVDLRRWRVVDRGMFWFSSEPETPGTRDPDARHPRACTWVELEERYRPIRMVVMNTHLDHQGAAARERALRLLERWGAEHADEPLFVIGDFNTERGDPSLEEFIERLRLDDVGEGQTFHRFGGDMEGPRIDFVLARGVDGLEQVHVEDSDSARASDHFPVVVDARLRVTLEEGVDVR